MRTKLVTPLVIFSTVASATLLARDWSAAGSVSSAPTQRQAMRVESASPKGESRPGMLVDAGDAVAPDRLDRQLGELAERMSDLEATVRSLSTWMDRVSLPTGQDVASRDVSSVDPEELIRLYEERAMVEEALANDALDQLAWHHSGEPVDAAWAAGMEVALTASFDQAEHLDHIVLDGIECRSTSCALDFALLPGGEAEGTVPRGGFDVLPWVSANAGACEIVAESPARLDQGMSQRFFLTNCE